MLPYNIIDDREEFPHGGAQIQWATSERQSVCLFRGASIGVYPANGAMMAMGLSGLC